MKVIKTNDYKKRIVILCSQLIKVKACRIHAIFESIGKCCVFYICRQSVCLLHDTKFVVCIFSSLKQKKFYREGKNLPYFYNTRAMYKLCYNLEACYNLSCRNVSKSR